VADIIVAERVFGDYGVEAVVHAGALHKPDIMRVHPSAFVDVNVTRARLICWQPLSPQDTTDSSLPRPLR
jgi:hypothetical protein